MKYLKLVYAFFIGVALWIVYKLFIDKNDAGNPDYDNTQQSTGLSSEDLSLFNRVISNLSNAVPYEVNTFDMTDLLWLPFAGVYDSYSNYNSYQGALELGKMLDKVSDKQQFGKAFLKKKKVTLDSAIVKGYGEYVYSMLSKNVPDFQSFLI